MSPRRIEKYVVYTVGHSNRGLAELAGILKRYSIRLVVDVRRYPGSRRVPWFSRRVLEKTLPEHGVAYYWLGDLLGGLNVDYPSYVETLEYRRGMGILISLILGIGGGVAVMCRERWWMRCHRAFIADTLHTIGFHVKHIIDLGKVEEHVELGVAPSWARRLRLEQLLGSVDAWKGL